MQFQVPQFIETEDKIIGGVLTLKQFLIIAAATGVSFIFYFLFELFTWIFMTTLVGIIAFGVAFLKIQGRSVPTIIVAAFHYYWNPRFYLWRSETAEAETVAIDISTVAKKTETPKQFTFHKKERAAQPVFNNQLPAEAKQAAEPKIETAPPDWREAASAKPPAVKASSGAPEEKLFKQEELLEHEVAELESAKARLESEMRKLVEEKSAATRRVVDAEKATSKTGDAFRIPTKAEAAKTKSSFKNLIGIQGRGTQGVPEGERAPETLLGIRHKLATTGSKVQNLFQQLSTSKTSLPKRERKLVDFGKNSKEKLELLRKATGEVELARRVDYSDARHP